MYPARVLYSAALFVLVMALIIIARPRALFRADGAPRPFGVSDGQEGGTTVFPLGVATVVVAVLSLYTFTVIDLVYS